MTDPKKICVAIASRGRPSALVGVIMGLQRLQSGRNMVAYSVAADVDDPNTEAMLKFVADEEIPVVLNTAPRAPYLGAAHNRAINQAQDADIVTLMSDRSYCITWGWDLAISEAAEKYPNRVLWWSSPVEADTTMPILPASVLDAVDWKYSPEIFPFWYDDTGWAEIDRMIHNAPSLAVRAYFGGMRGKTTRLRDLAFWTTLYAALRPRRIEQAKMIAARLNLPWTDPPEEMMADFLNRDKHLIENAEALEQAFGDPSAEVTPEYLDAKENGKRLMEELRS